MKAIKTIVPFLFYTKNGTCKSNAKMPKGSESFEGWFSAAHVLRNQSKHTNSDIKASLSGLRRFLFELRKDEEIKQKELLRFV